MPITGLAPTTSVIRDQCLNQCATDANIYVGLTIHNITYLFNINSRKLDGYYRSWIEYLTDHYLVCILDRSIKLDNIKHSLQVFCTASSIAYW